MNKNRNPETQQILSEAFDWMMILEDPDITAKEQCEFEDWLKRDPRHATIFNKAIQSKRAFNAYSMKDFRKSVHQPTLYERLMNAYDASRKMLANLRLQYVIASTILVVSLTVIVSNTAIFGTSKPLVKPQTNAIFESKKGEIRSLELIDGSRVTLAPDTAIKTSFSASQRRVSLLRGAAFFEVARDQSRVFDVQSDMLRATVIGTSFSVKKSATQSRVSVAEGQVDVSFPHMLDGEAVPIMNNKILAAGEQISANENSGLLTVSTIALEDIAGWREGRLIYDGVSIAEFLEDANRYSAIPISVAIDAEDILQMQISGVFRGHDVYEMLDTLSAVHNVRIDISGSTAIVLRLKETE